MKDKNVCFLEDNFGFGYSLTINSSITTFYNSLNPNSQLFDSVTQSFPLNQVEWRDAGNLKDNNIMFMVLGIRK